jgi:glycosyltransferase involved in cell wall biosynthesis
MRVLLVHDYAAPLGGAEHMNRTLADGLRRRGHEVRLFTSTAEFERTPLAARPDYQCRGTTSRWRTLLQSANPWAPAALRRAIGDFRPDVVHVKMFLTQLSPLILPVLRDVPSLYHAVWYRAVCPTGSKLLPTGTACASPAGTVCLTSGCVPVRDWVPLMGQLRLLRRWRSAFRAIIANSRHTAAVLAQGGLSPATVVPNGVPDPGAGSATSRTRLAGQPAAVFVGRLVREKGLDTLLTAFSLVRARHADAVLDIVGDGPARPQVEASIRALGLTSAVRLHGQLPHGRAAAVASAAWVQVVPSRWAEPFGIVAVEAMMRGTAVIASDSGGLADVVRDGVTGLHVPPGDVSALAAALDALFADRDRAERFGAAGRDVAVREYSEDVHVERILDVYRRIADQPRRGAAA